jgi:cell division protein FtsN
MKDKIETPVFIVFLVGAFVFSCITFVLGIWVCDSSHQTSKELSTVKVVDNYSDEITADDLNILDDKGTNNFNIESVEKKTQADSKVENTLADNSKISNILKNNNKISNKKNVKKTGFVKKLQSKPSVGEKPVAKKKSVKKINKASQKTDKKTTEKKRQYYVQIIATSQKSVALKEKKKLERKGYNVFLIKAKKGNKTIYKVRIGTFNTRLQANKIAKKIKKEYKITPWIL